MASHILIKALGLIYKVYLTNKNGFGDQGNAICGSGFQIYAIILTVSSIGIPNAVSKLVSERVALGDFKGAHNVFKIAFLTFSFIGLICSLFLYLGARTIANSWLQIPEAEYTLIALSPSVFFVTLINVIRGYFNGRENLRVTANSQTIEQIIKIIFTIIIVEILSVSSGGNTSLMAAGANIAITLASVICFIYLFMYYWGARKEIGDEIINTNSSTIIRTRKIIKQIIIVSLPMVITAFLGSMNKTIDSITVVRGLKRFLTESEAKAQYGIIVGKIETLIMLPMSFNIALTTGIIPKISSLNATGDSNQLKSIISKSILFTILIGLPCTIGLITFSEPILKLLFPNQDAGTLALKISSISIIFIVLEQTLNGISQGFGKYLLPIYALSFGAIVKLTLNLILVSIDSSKFIFGGIYGAIISSVITHMVICIIELIILKKKLNIQLENKLMVNILKIILSTIIMMVFSKNAYKFLLQNYSQKISTIIIIILASFIYFLSIYFMKIINFKDFFDKNKGKNKNAETIQI